MTQSDSFQGGKSGERGECSGTSRGGEADAADAQNKFIVHLLLWSTDSVLYCRGFCFVDAPNAVAETTRRGRNQSYQFVSLTKKRKTESHLRQRGDGPRAGTARTACRCPTGTCASDGRRTADFGVPKLPLHRPTHFRVLVTCLVLLAPHRPPVRHRKHVVRARPYQRWKKSPDGSFYTIVVIPDSPKAAVRALVSFSGSTSAYGPLGGNVGRLDPNDS